MSVVRHLGRDSRYVCAVDEISEFLKFFQKGFIGLSALVPVFVSLGSRTAEDFSLNFENLVTVLGESTKVLIVDDLIVAFSEIPTMGVVLVDGPIRIRGLCSRIGPHLRREILVFINQHPESMIAMFAAKA